MRVAVASVVAGTELLLSVAAGDVEGDGAASGMQNVSVSEMSQVLIDERNQSLNLHWLVFQSAKPITSIAAMHHFQVKCGEVKAYLLTKDKTTSAAEDESNTPTSSSSADHSASASDPDNLTELVDKYFQSYQSVRYLRNTFLCRPVMGNIP